MSLGKPDCKRISRSARRYSTQAVRWKSSSGTSGKTDQSDSRSNCFARSHSNSALVEAVGRAGASPTITQPVSLYASPSQLKSPILSINPARPKIGPQFSGSLCGSFSASPLESFFSCHSLLILYLLRHQGRLKSGLLFGRGQWICS